MATRRPLLAGNWKMYKTREQAAEFVRAFAPLVAGPHHADIVLAPPFTALEAVRAAMEGTDIGLAAQNVHWEKEGAETGEVSPTMLVAAGCAYVIIGHSERRHHYGESDEAVNKKVKAAMGVGLVPIICVGESLRERESGQTENVLESQFDRGLAGLTPAEFSRIIIAYEPVWAIGTGKTATPEMAEEAHTLIRGFARRVQGKPLADGLRILYGGSVKPDNVSGLMASEEIDGALVGGASLKPESFAAIVNYR